MGKQTMIGVDRGDYDRLNEKKKAIEELIGRRVTWGDFLLILAGLHSPDELASKQLEVAELHEALTEAEEIPCRRDIEEIVRGEADRIIGELKGAK